MLPTPLKRGRRGSLLRALGDQVSCRGTFLGLEGFGCAYPHSTRLVDTAPMRASVSYRQFFGGARPAFRY
jgi:hypothetical protein